MRDHTEKFFRSTPLMRWALSPFLILFIALMPFLIPEWTVVRALLMVGVEVVCLGFLLGLWLPPRHARLSFRIVALLVFVAYALYLYFEFFISTAPFTFTGGPGASPRKALAGFVAIGIPCLLFAIYGRGSREPTTRTRQPDR